MLSVNLRLSDLSRWRSILSKFGRLTENWGWEFNVYKNGVLLALSLEIRLTGDHRGIELGAGLLSYELDLSIYDRRHEDAV